MNIQRIYTHIHIHMCTYRILRPMNNRSFINNTSYRCIYVFTYTYAHTYKPTSASHKPQAIHK